MMKNTMTTEQKAKEISELIIKAQELMNKALELVDDEVSAYVEQKADETDFADKVSAVILSFSDDLHDYSKEFYHTVNDRE